MMMALCGNNPCEGLYPRRERDSKGAQPLWWDARAKPLDRGKAALRIIRWMIREAGADLSCSGCKGEILLGVPRGQSPLASLGRGGAAYGAK